MIDLCLERGVNFIDTAMSITTNDRDDPGTNLEAAATSSCWPPRSASRGEGADEKGLSRAAIVRG